MDSLLDDIPGSPATSAEGGCLGDSICRSLSLSSSVHDRPTCVSSASEPVSVNVDVKVLNTCYNASS